MLGPKITYDDVARELSDGLADGTVVLDWDVEVVANHSTPVLVQEPRARLSLAGLFDKLAGFFRNLPRKQLGMVMLTAFGVVSLNDDTPNHVQTTIFGITAILFTMASDVKSGRPG